MNRIARWVPGAALLALLLLLVAGPGTRLEIWGFRFGFMLLGWAVCLALASGLLALLMLFVSKFRAERAGILLASLVLAAGVAAVPAWQLKQARSLPMIHDITTDLIDPPAFQSILSLRASAPNPPEHGGAELARQQRIAYPDIQPLLVPVEPAQVFAQALAIARDLGWVIVMVDPEQGLIEATDTTFWFGFKDDVVIRISASEEGSRVDLRSKSRVGLSDVGANAARIRRFLGRLNERL